MDPEAVFERADVTEQPGDLLPGGTDADTYVATDPETDCRGAGRFEQEARTNLVYAVEAYREHPEDTVPYMSSGRGQTHEMRWLREDDPSLAERVEDLLPF